MSFDIMKLSEKTVTIFLNHIIYGKQELYISSFKPFTNKERIGFVLNGHEIYLYNNEIERIERNKNLIKIVGKLQTITINII